MLDTTRSVDLLDRIGEGVFGLDHEGRFAYLNGQARHLLHRMFGLELDAPIGRPIWDQSPAIDAGPLGWAVRRASAERRPVTAAMHDGAGNQVEIRAYPAEDGLLVLLLESPPVGGPEVLDRISDLYLACDAEWRLTLLNTSARGYLARAGREPRDLLGCIIWDAVPELIGSRFQSEAFRAVAEQSEVEFEALFRPAERWFAVRITPMAEGIVASARDITGARRRERALAREAERLAEVIDTQQAVATAGPGLGAVMRVVCERLQRLTRAPAAAVFLPEDEELVLCEGSGFATAHLGLRLPRAAGLAGQALAAGKVLRSDDTAEDGRSEPAIARAILARSALLVPLPVGREQGVVALWSDRPGAFNDLHEQTVRLVAGLLGAAMDQASVVAAHQLLLGERVATAAALRAGEDRFRVLVESIDDVVFRLDREQRCVDILGRWIAREGFRAEQFLGRTTREIVGPPEAAMHERANLRALAGETVTYEWVCRTRRGPRHMQTTLSPLRGPGGEVTGIVGLGRDISQRIEAEQQVRQAQKMEAVGQFAGGVAHDLNNMMMIIVGFSDFLLSTLERHDPRWSDADEIRKAAERAMHLTRQLLGFGRLRLVAREVVSLNAVVTGMERMLRPLLGEDIPLRTVLDAGLGGVEADYGQLEQVVMNLALNARDAMRGGGRLTIETANLEVPEGAGAGLPGADLPPGPYVVLVVRDTGEGMTPEVKAHLFEPFFTTKPATQNTGLGLATVYGIVVQSGGYIRVESEPERGAAFHLCFPRVPADEDDGARAADATPPLGGSETVLVVEDEEAVRALACRVLRQRGYAIIEARHGAEALAMLQDGGAVIDLVLTDVVMPEMGGPELVRRLGALLPGIPVVYMSGYTESDKLQPGILDSETPFLQKPFSADDLALRVREALDRVGR